MSDRSVGVYVHVPFCERVCPYCDFAVVAARPLAERLEDRYVDALLAELAVRRGAFAGRVLTTVYLGGGTPSLLRADSVERILAAVFGAFDVAPDVEVTLEANPSTVERSRLPAFRAVGVNRLSLGIQSFDDETLRRLGRAHRAGECHATLCAARDAGFDNVSLDLIFAVPGQTRQRFAADLDAALRFAPEHVAVYELTIEPGTPYATAVARGRLALPCEEDAVWMMEEARARLEAAGLRAYELSNHARPGRESRHNRRYWERLPVLGLGMGAWSTEPRDEAAPFGARRSNVRGLATYLRRVERGLEPRDGPTEVHDAATARGEAVFLALRTARGLDRKRFEAEFGAPPRAFFGSAIEELARAGLLVESGDGGLALSAHGRLLSDSVFERFV